jgi:hypothetical protein
MSHFELTTITTFPTAFVESSSGLLDLKMYLLLGKSIFNKRNFLERSK